MKSTIKNRSAFTLIELLIVIVIIGIITTITIIVYPKIRSRAQASKVANAAQKIYDGLAANLANGQAMPSTSFCLNYESDKVCANDDFGTPNVHHYDLNIKTNRTMLDELNKQFSIKGASHSSFFHDSDIVYLSGVSIIDSPLKSNEPGPNDYSGVHPAIAYFIGQQTDCGNKEALWALGTSSPLNLNEMSYKLYADKAALEKQLLDSGVEIKPEKNGIHEIKLSNNQYTPNGQEETIKITLSHFIPNYKIDSSTKPNNMCIIPFLHVNTVLDPKFYN